MIHVKYRGRFGNNLFQHALGRILASKLGYQLSHENGIWGGVDNLAHFPHLSSSLRGKSISHPAITLEGHYIELDKLLESAEDRKIILNGFFQRYEYYRPYKDLIKDWLYLEPLDVGQTEEDVIIHLRLGDDVLKFDENSPYIMPFEYYEQSLSLLNFKNLYICSDPETRDSKYVRQFDSYNPILLEGNVIEDFRALCSFNKIIISQSSYSWWGAFLSNAAEIFFPIPAPTRCKLKNGNPFSPSEWSLECEEISLIVDDEPRYNYLKQYNKEWKTFYPPPHDS